MIRIFLYGQLRWTACIKTYASKGEKCFNFDEKQSKDVSDQAYEVRTVQTVMSEFFIFCTFFTLLEHELLRGLESNKKESLYINKNLIELACSFSMGKKLVSSLFCKKELDQYFPNTDLMLVQ